MPSVIFIEKDAGNRDAYWAETGDVLTSSTMPWSPSLKQLMTLSRADLCNLLPSNAPKVSKNDNKEQLASILIEMWPSVLLDASSSSGSGSGGKKGYDGNGGDGNEEGDKNDDEGDNPDPAIYGLGDFYLTVQKNFNGVSFKNYLVNGNYTIAVLKALIANHWNINPIDQRLLHRGVDVDDFYTLNDLGIDHTTVVTLLLRVRGGAGGIPVQKPYLKKDVAMSQMKQKMKEQHLPYPELNVNDGELPQSLLDFLTEQKVILGEIVALKSRLGSSFTSTVLKQLDRDTLNSLCHIFESNRMKRGEKNMTVNEKILKSLNLLHPQLKVINQSINKITFFQGEVVSEMMTLFCDEFTTYSEQSGNIKLNGERFYEKVKGELERREERHSSVNEEAVSSNCVLM